MSYHKYFKINDSKIWQGSRIDLSEKGNIIVAKTVLTGFGLTKRFHIGPILFRPYIEKVDKVIGTWGTGAKCCVMELIYRDSHDNTTQKSPISLYAEPSGIIDASYHVIQILVDSWIGMLPTKHFNLEGEMIGTFGSSRQSTADSGHAKPDPIINNIDKKLFFKALDALYGKMGISIRRYNIASCEIMEEAIVDFVITLDSLLGYGLETEIAHRVACRGSLLLSKNKSEREAYYNGLKYLYASRSKMVHGKSEEILKPSNKEKAALEKFGVNFRKDHFFNRYEVAEFARTVARNVIKYFIINENNLNNEWLLQLELGIIKK